MRAVRALIQPLFTVFVASVLVTFGALAAEPVKVVVLEPGSGALETLLRREVASAAELGKVPFVQLTAEWCGPCKKLRASLGDPLMLDAFAGTYLIQVDVDAWRGELKAAGFEHPAIPVFFEVDDLARPTGTKIDGGAWGEDIPRNIAPPMKQFFTGVFARRR
jgi:thiol-disulfide isomerase/thioredoxin